tara:strand:- start:276 stop:989 length:714 start_codon:yes stop_codon:yes gene_type:complete
MKKPLIGITLDSENPGNYSKFPWYAIRHNYLHSIEKLGGIPFPLLHSSKNIKNISSVIDGLIITGGNFDIDPKLYGKKLEGSRNVKNNRTNFEMKICQNLINSTKPILGICGGEQLLNVVCNGTLIQDIKTNNLKIIRHEQSNPRNQTSHKIKILKNTKLMKIIKKENVKVNSAHHQAVDKLGDNLIVSSYSEDGIIESIEHIKHPWCIGVQWHPEFLITTADQLLLKNFINSAKLK